MVASRVDEEIAILRSWKRMPSGYDATAKKVNEEISKLGDAGTFADLAGIDKKLGLRREPHLRWGDMLTTLRLWMTTDPASDPFTLTYSRILPPHPLIVVSRVSCEVS